MATWLYVVTLRGRSHNIPSPYGLCSCKSGGYRTMSAASSSIVCFVLNHSGCKLGCAVCYMAVWQTLTYNTCLFKEQKLQNAIETVAHFMYR